MPVDLAERMHAGIPSPQIEIFRGGHMFFLFSKRQQFLNQASRFLAGSAPEPAETRACPLMNRSRS